jgi:hypothetical protein
MLSKLIIILVFLTNIAFAKNITVTGYGNSKDEALKSAFQNAVEQEVGVLVDSKTVIRNNKLIKNKILTYSNGFIKDYKKISAKQQMGFWTVKINAVVESQKLLSKIKEIKLKPMNIENTDKLYAQVVSQVKTKFDAEDLFKNIYKNYNYIPTSLYALKVISFKVDTDLATRTTVPITIKVKIIRKEPSYELRQKVEDMYKLIDKMSIGSYSEKRYDYHKHFPNEIFVYSFKHGMRVFGFPRSYSVIYPFVSQGKPRYAGRSGNEEAYRNAHFGPVKQVVKGETLVTLLDKNGNILKKWDNIFHPLDSKTSSLWISSMISSNMINPKLMINVKWDNNCNRPDYCMNAYLYSDASFNNVVNSPLWNDFYPKNDNFYDTVIIKSKIPVKYLQQIKQVKAKINWVKHKPWKWWKGRLIIKGDGKMI